MFYEKTVLENGVTVVSENMESTRSVALSIWVRVGSRDEAPGEFGMSHFMEHMLFKGTPTRTAAEISMAFDGLGAELNAFTSKEHTCFYSRMLDERMPECFEMLADMVVNASLAQEDIELEREVIIEEIAQSEDQPEDQVYELFAQALYPGHGIGRPILGTKSSVRRFTSADMRRFHDAHYTAENLFVCAAGNVSHETLVELSRTFLGCVPRGKRLARDAFAARPGPALRAMEKRTEQAHVLIGCPSIAMDDTKRYVYSVLDHILGGCTSSRLFQEIREQRGLAYSVYTNNQMYTDCGSFSVYAATRPENLTEVLDLSKAILDRTAEEGVTKRELDRSIELACGNFVLGMESTRSHMVRLGRFLSCCVAFGSMDDVMANYRAVTLEDVNEAAAQLLSREMTVAVVSPYSEEEIERIAI